MKLIMYKKIEKKNKEKSHVQRIHVIKMPVLSKAIYGFNAISTELPRTLSTDLESTILQSL